MFVLGIRLYLGKNGNKIGGIFTATGKLLEKLWDEDNSHYDDINYYLSKLEYLLDVPDLDYKNNEYSFAFKKSAITNGVRQIIDELNYYLNEIDYQIIEEVVNIPDIEYEDDKQFAYNIEKFDNKLDENIEDSGFTIMPNTIQACKNIINSYYLHPKISRGAKQARDLIISKYNDKHKTTLDSDDYVFHHRNGLHSIDDFKNAVLLNKSAINHNTLHANIYKALILKYAAYKKYKTGNSISPALFTGMTLFEQYKLLDMYLQMSELKTDRTKNSLSNVDIIYASEL